MVCLIFKGILTNNWESIPQTRPTTSENTDFLANFRVFFSIFPSFFLYFLSVFSPFSTEVWHLWQQKNNIAVGTRAPTRVREKHSPKILPLLFFSFSLLPLSCFLGSFFFPFLPVFPPSSSFFLLLSPSFFFFLLLSCFLRSLSLSPSSLLGRVIQYFKISYLLFLYCSFGVIQRGKCSFPRFLHALGQYLPIYK